MNTWKERGCRKGYHDLDLNSKLYDFAILLMPSDLNRAQDPMFVLGWCEIVAKSFLDRKTARLCAILSESSPSLSQPSLPLTLSYSESCDYDLRPQPRVTTIFYGLNRFIIKLWLVFFFCELDCFMFNLRVVFFFFFCVDLVVLFLELWIMQYTYRHRNTSIYDLAFCDLAIPLSYAFT